jgi:hypothetical protein
MPATAWRRAGCGATAEDPGALAHADEAVIGRSAARGPRGAVVDDVDGDGIRA